MFLLICCFRVCIVLILKTFTLEDSTHLVAQRVAPEIPSSVVDGGSRLI